MSSLALPTQSVPPPLQPAPSAAASSSLKPNAAATSSSAGANTGNAKKRVSIAPPAPNTSHPKEKSPSPADEEDDDDEDEDDEPRKKKKKTKSGVTSEYKYTNEIAAMMFVFGEVQEPLPETIKLVEDVVRGQIIEIVTRARLLTHLRSSRYLSAEDLIFLIREDRSKVNRLRTYLSWKDVRKKAKEDDAGPGGGAAEVEDELEDTDKSTLKTRKTMVKLPWELMTPYSDFLKSLPTSSAGKDEEDEGDDDEVQAHHDSMQRLREADEITRKMSKDEYVHYSDCRQASFTYRKARRFRDFINFSAYLDVRPNDDIIDILGFLAFEMVRSLCVTALEVRERHEAPLRQSAPQSQPQPSGSGAGGTSPVKRKSTINIQDSPVKRTKSDRISPDHETSSSRRHVPVPLFAAPPSARQPLTSAHVLEAYAQIQRQQAANRVGGMRNFRGALTKGRMALV